MVKNPLERVQTCINHSVASLCNPWIMDKFPDDANIMNEPRMPMETEADRRKAEGICSECENFIIEES